MALAVLLCVAQHASSVQVKPVYTVGEERIYGVSVTTHTVSPTGKRSVKPVVKAFAVFKYTVLSAQPDGSVRMRIDPVGAVLNGKQFNSRTQLGESVVIKINRYGKVIAVEVPATKYTAAKNFDLQPYMTEAWSKTPWIPEKNIRKGETWTYSKQNQNMEKSKGEVKVTLASENEMSNGIACCRFDMTGTSNVIIDEALASTLANPPKNVPPAVVEKCRPYVAGITGQGTMSNSTQCWISLKDGGIVAASGKSKSSFSMNTGEKLFSKQYSYILENESQLRRLVSGEVTNFLTVSEEDKRDFIQDTTTDSITGGNTFAEKMKKLSNTKGYMSIVMGVSIFDLLLIEGPLDFIDFSFELHGRILPNHIDYTNLELSAGLKIGVDLPIIDFLGLFIGAGTYWGGDMAADIKPGKVSPGISTALLFAGSSFSPSSAEIGLTTSIIKLGFGCNVSLKDIVDTSAR